MMARFLYTFLLLAIFFNQQEAGFVLNKDIVRQIHLKGADGRRIIFVKGNCDSDKFYSLELKMCVRIITM